MSLFLLLIARILAANGVPVAVCGDDIVIGASCTVAATASKPQRPATPPPAIPPAPTSEATKHTIPLDPKSISNGF
jgi:hypothetical protein